MSRFVNFTSENLLSTLNSQDSHLIPKLLANSLHFRGGLHFCGFKDTLGFNLRLSLGFVKDRLGSLFAIGHDGRSAGPSLSLNRLTLLSRYR